MGLIPEEKPLVRSEAQVSFWGVSNMDDEYQYFLDNGATVLEPPQNVGGEIEVALMCNCVLTSKNARLAVVFISV